LYRFNLELEDPHLLAEGLRGCCQRCDIVARGGVLYLAENSAHRVVLYDREGNVLKKWGERGRDDLETFGACCNPMNICFDQSGLMYTAESGLGRVKRYTADGKFVDLVGYVGTNRFWHGSGLAASCSNMAIAATPDGERVYVMDHRNKRIRVLQKKPASANDESVVTGE
jgi:sugar lactone lactonase YvrE